MYPQIACLRRGIITLVAFFHHCAFSKKMHTHIGCICSTFSSVRFEMFPQIACLRRCIVTLVAFVWLFSTVIFKMNHQSVYVRIRKVTIVAFVWLFSTVFSNVSSNHLPEGKRCHIGCICWSLLHCALSAWSSLLSSLSLLSLSPSSSFTSSHCCRRRRPPPPPPPSCCWCWGWSDNEVLVHEHVQVHAQVNK